MLLEIYQNYNKTQNNKFGGDKAISDDLLNNIIQNH